MFKGKTIFIAPLDWGLGHATRCVPIIRQLLKENVVLLGVTPLTKLIFDEEFPGTLQLELPPYDVKYSNILPLWLKLGLDSPRITQVILEENRLLEKFIDDHKIDVVISDSRFGLFTKKAQTVFITHQLFLKTPLLNLALQIVNRNYILKFDEVWVPDHEDATQGISGELSHGAHYHKSVKYIGPLSRLKDAETSLLQKHYDVLLLLSGPEPLRTELERSLAEKFKHSEKKIVMVRGNKHRNNEINDTAMDIFDLPDKEKLKGLIGGSQKIICRSGYSTLMDMHILQKKNLVLIPTPGQTEQEYLAELWKEKFGATVITESEIHKL